MKYEIKEELCPNLVYCFGNHECLKSRSQVILNFRALIAVIHQNIFSNRASKKRNITGAVAVNATAWNII